MGPDVSAHSLTEMITYSEGNVVGETATKMQEEIFQSSDSIKGTSGSSHCSIEGNRV